MHTLRSARSHADYSKVQLDPRLDEIRFTGPAQPRGRYRATMIRVAVAGIAIVALMIAALGVSIWRSRAAATAGAIALADRKQLVVAAAGRDLLFDEATVLTGTPVIPSQKVLVAEDQHRFAQTVKEASSLATGRDEELLTRIGTAGVHLSAIEQADMPLLGHAGGGVAFGYMRTARNEVDRALDAFVAYNANEAAGAEARSSTARRGATTVGLVVGSLAVLLATALVAYVLVLLRRLFVRASSDAELLERRLVDLEQARADTLHRLALAAEYRDDDTLQHTERVGGLAAAVGARMGLSSQTVELIRQAAPLHDIGKLGVSDTILRKPAKLTAEERAAMQQHTSIGASILAGSEHPVLALGEKIALSHHERWDVSGYPQGLAGEAIPLAARIVAVADVFDALVHERPYKHAWPLADALAEIRGQSGRQFDAAVVAAFLTVEHRQFMSHAHVMEEEATLLPV